jgi:site-specific DNA-methyltransferase (cytosine-N4-specific)
VVVTSPPYGDNTSTVPYGQHAYLPLQWIDMSDIDVAAGNDYLSSTYEIDRRSLGGEKYIEACDECRLRSQSPALNDVVDALANEKRDRRNRVLAFTRDLDAALGVIAGTLEYGGVAAWTVGSRRVGGQIVPLEQMLVDLASAHGFSHIGTLDREIPPHRKRMAARNRTGATMQQEHVVVLRRIAP